MIANYITLETRDAWLAERLPVAGGPFRLGCSQVAAALGQDPFCSAFRLWAHLTGKLPPEDLAAEREEVEWGILHEPNIVAKFAKVTGREVTHNNSYTVAIHPELPWFRCTLDATQLKSDRSDPGDLQCKSTSAWLAHEWRGKAPLRCLIQVQSELAVTGMQWGSLACLVGGNRFKYFDFERDQAFIDAMMPHLEKFRWHVENDTPPEIDGSCATADTLKQMHPNDNGFTVDMPTEACEWSDSLEDIKAEIDRLTGLRELHENKLKYAIGDATFGRLSDGRLYSLKTRTVKEHVRRESTSRVLRLTKEKR